MLGTVVQIEENGLIWFGKRSFNAVNFQRPDWICGSFYTAFKLTRLVEIGHVNERGELFSPFSNRPPIRCRWLCSNRLLTVRLLTSLFRAATTSASLFTRILRGQGFSFFIAACHIDNSGGIFKNFAPAGQFVDNKNMGSINFLHVNTITGVNI